MKSQVSERELLENLLALIEQQLHRAEKTPMLFNKTHWRGVKRLIAVAIRMEDHCGEPGGQRAYLLEERRCDLHRAWSGGAEVRIEEGLDLPLSRPGERSDAEDPILPLRDPEV